MQITALIHTYNAEKFLERVLDSLKDFDEVLICDMYSTDKTIEIAQKYNCRIIYFEYSGGVPEPARTYAISQVKTEWVLVVDADEIVPTALKNYLYRFEEDNKEYTALRIPRKNYFMGKFISSAYPDYILRFFKAAKAEWPVRLHSHPQIDGLIKTIPKKNKELAFIHLSNEAVQVVIQKMNRYTELERERRKDKNYTFLSLLVEPFVRFLRFYIFKMGFRDGLPGFIWACMYSYYKFITIAKVLESKRNKIDPELLENESSKSSLN